MVLVDDFVDVVCQQWSIQQEGEPVSVHKEQKS